MNCVEEAHEVLATEVVLSVVLRTGYCGRKCQGSVNHMAKHHSPQPCVYTSIVVPKPFVSCVAQIDTWEARDLVRLTLEIDADQVEEYNFQSGEY